MIVSRGPIWQKTQAMNAAAARRELTNRIYDLRAQGSGLRPAFIAPSPPPPPVVISAPVNLPEVVAQRHQVLSRMMNGYPTLRYIRALVADYVGASVDALSSDSRTHKIVRGRHLYFWMAHKYTAQSTTEIGRVVGGKDHSTVISACHRITREWARSHPQFVEDLMNLRSKIGAECDLDPFFWGS